MVGDARQAEVLTRVGVERCRAICTVTSDDLINLTAALNARAIRPDLRVVLRLFDPELALRAQHGLSIRFTRSVSHLAAPAFAAGAIGSQVEASIPVGDKRVLLFAPDPRRPRGRRSRRLPIATLEQPGDVTVLGVQARRRARRLGGRRRATCKRGYGRVRRREPAGPRPPARAVAEPRARLTGRADGPRVTR